MMADYAAQRAHMVQSQLSTNDVPGARRAMAYCDLPVEVAPGRYLLDPRSLAKLLALAGVRPTDHVLDVGCATGYSTAVLALLAKSVVALEQDADLVRQATERLSAVADSTVVQGALVEGAEAQAPYDAIIVEGGIEEAPQTILAQLAEGGRISMRPSRSWWDFGSRLDLSSDTPHKTVS